MASTAGNPGYGHPQGSYVVVNAGVPVSAHPRPMLKVEYSKANKNSVKGLTLAQLVMGVVILIFHIITTTINDNFIHELKIAEDKSGIRSIYLSFADHAATGVWVGIMTVIASGIGIYGYKQQRRGLIVSHLVLNVLLLFCFPALIGTLSATISEINNCRSNGYSYYKYSSYYYPTTTASSYWLYGEKLTEPSGTYYCQFHTFKAWLALDSIMLVCAILEFIITLTLLVYNSIASCFCCRSTGCCGKCCCNSCCPALDDDAIPVTNMTPQSTAAPVGVVQMQPFPQTHVYASTPGIPQPIPQVYASPVANPIYAQPTAPAPAVPAQPPPTQPATGAPGAQGTTEGKWEELPPEYAAVTQGNSN